jgi:Ca2+-binding RTX toxin-like protein
VATFDGTPGVDIYEGTADADTINGNGGDDTLAGGDGGDTIDGGDGHDTIYSNLVSPPWGVIWPNPDPIVPVLDTGSEIDTIRGGAGLDTIYAGYGDRVDGGTDGAHLLISLQGASSGVTADFRQLLNNGSLVIGGGTITNVTGVLWIDGSNFNDVITGPQFQHISTDIRGFGGNDTLIQGYQGDLYGGDGDDVLDGRQSLYGGYLYGESGNDTLYLGESGEGDGGDGDDTFFGSGYMIGGSGNDTFNATGAIYSSYIYGDVGDDTVNGSVQDDRIFGGEGADLLRGGGDDDLIHSAGSRNPEDGADQGMEYDRLYGEEGNDTLHGGYGDLIDGGSGNNALFLSLTGGTAGVTFSGNALLAGSVTIAGGMISNIQRIYRVDGTRFNDVISMPGQTFMSEVHGGDGNDELTAGDTSVTFYGDAGNDTLRGGLSDDHLYGGAGADTISGGGGSDTIYLKAGDIAAGETIDGGTGTDTIEAIDFVTTVDLSGIAISNVERIIGNNLILTAAQLSGRSLLSFQSLTVATGGAVSLAGATVHGSTLNLASAGNNLDMTGATVSFSNFTFTVNGGGANDVITTSGARDTLNGGGGDDILNAGGNHDVLNGGAGRDSMYGGEGNDRIVVAAADFVAGEIYDGGTGSDELQLFGNVDISSATLISIETLGIGYNQSVSLTGAQLQSITKVWTPGYSGYLTQQLNLTTGGAIAYSGSGDVLVFTLSNAATAFDASGIVAALAVTVNGGTGNDVITGSRFDDSLNGGGGNDELIGGLGRDTLTGGAGDDSYYLEDSADRVIEAFGEGSDTIYSSATVSSTNSFNVETIHLLGTGAIGATGDNYANSIHGNDAANVLYGRGGNDILDGGAGADQMTGGTGDDVYYVDDLGDVVTELAGEGIDEVRTTIATLSPIAHVERLVYIGSQSALFTGDSSDNGFTGAAANDIFRLEAGGDDIASGGAGNDGFYLGAAFGAGDLVDGGDGNDQLALQGGYALTFSAGNFTNVETIALLSGSVTEFGESGSNRYDYSLTSVDATVAAGQRLTVSGAGLLADEDFTFDGSAETDGSFILFGGFGQETLIGGAGSDGFFFGDGRFTVGVDRVNGFAGADDQLALRGDYDVTFAADSIANIDTIGLISARDARYGQLGESFSYRLVMNDGNLASGAQMTINGAGLGATERLLFYGMAELGGSFRIIGGEAADTLIGGAGADIIFGGLGADRMSGEGGADRFVYTDIAQSTAAARDTIAGFSAADVIDLSGIDAIAGGGNDAFTFVAGGAFTGAAGQLILVQDGADWLLQGDTNGDGVADLVIGILASGYTPVAGDFIL